MLQFHRAIATHLSSLPRELLGLINSHTTSESNILQDGYCPSMLCKVFGCQCFLMDHRNIQTGDFKINLVKSSMFSYGISTKMTLKKPH